MENNYELKAYKYKIKYLNLKNKNNSQIAGVAGVAGVAAEPRFFSERERELSHNKINITEGGELYKFILSKHDDKLNKLQIAAKKKLKKSIKKFEESIERTQKLINQYYELENAERKAESKPKSMIKNTLDNLGWGDDKGQIALSKVYQQFNDDPFHDTYYSNLLRVQKNVIEFENALKDIIAPKKKSIFSSMFSPKKSIVI
jgi:hypothetical protein